MLLTDSLESFRKRELRKKVALFVTKEADNKFSNQQTSITSQSKTAAKALCIFARLSLSFCY